MMKKMNKKSIMAIVFAAMFVFASVAGIFLPKQASAVGKRGKIRSVRVTSVKKLTAGKTSKIKVKVNPKKVAAKVTFKTSNKSIATVRCCKSQETWQSHYYSEGKIKKQKN